MEDFETTIVVRFGDVDGAGIVFYPRYFEMMSIAVEDWCARRLGHEFGAMHLQQKWGIPAVDISASFVRPSVLSDRLTVRVVPQTVGTSSCKLRVDFLCGSEHRLEMHMTVVCMDLDARRSRPWPDDVRQRIQSGIHGTRVQ